MARAKRQASVEAVGGLTSELVDTLAAGVQTPADLHVLYRQFQKAIAKRVLKAELTQHLGYPDGGERGEDGNARNGSRPKTVLTDTGRVALDIPRDRTGSFTPQFVPK